MYFTSINSHKRFFFTFQFYYSLDNHVKHVKPVVVKHLHTVLHICALIHKYNKQRTVRLLK